MRILNTPYPALLSVALFFGLLVWWDSTSVYTQAVPTIPYQLTNQHLAVTSAAPTGFTELNGVVYFGLTSKKRGLWKTDGTAQGTVLVKDVQLLPTTLQRIGDRLYFAVEDDSMRSLWQSDGTEAGTLPLKTDFSLSYGFQFAAIGKLFYFAAADPEHGIELWQSDGTTAGTQLVSDLNPGEASSYPEQLTVNHGLLYFVAYNEQNRTALWQSDGTAAGTHPIASGGGYPQSLAVMQSALYFVGYDSAHGGELWRYDSGAATSTLVLDISPGPQSAYLEDFTVIGNRLFFVANDSQHGSELWQSDGTPVGTSMVKDIFPGAVGALPTALTAVGNLLYFQATDQNLGVELWKSDGTTAGTGLVKDLNPGAASATPISLTAMNGLLYFFARNVAGNTSLWQSDGTEAGTTTVAPVQISYYYGKLLTAIGNKLYFSGYDEGHGDELWISDGTASGTAFVKELDANQRGPEFLQFAQRGNRFYFVTASLGAFGYEQPKLWMSDGRDAPAILIDDHLPFYVLYPLADTLLIAGHDGTSSVLWRHDGGRDAPVLVSRFANATLRNLIVLQGKLFFHVAPDSNTLPQINDLWRSDGTGIGTVKLITGTTGADAPLPTVAFQGRVIATRGNELWIIGDTPATTTHFTPQGLVGSIIGMVSTANALYFVANSALGPFDRNDTLWRSDGTAQGTYRLTLEPEVTYIPTLIPAGNGLYMITTRSASWSSELWYNDGTAPTMKLLTTLTPAQYYANFSGATVVNNQLFFTADDGIHGPELWRSDGTPEGTVMLKDIVPPVLADVPAAYPGPLFEFGDLLYFGANDGVHGQELWRTDGTTAGTVLFKEINPTAAGSSPANFIGHTGLFFFAANDGRYGRELWQSDGGATGTQLVADLYPGAPSADPYGRMIMSDTLYFLADNGRDGQQLFDLRTGVPLALPVAQEPSLPAPYHLYFPITKP